MLILVKTQAGAWAVDWRETPEAERIRELFGTTVLELPVGTWTPRDAAMDVALGSPAGRQYGVRS